jgi:hypothetical protein
MKKKVRKNNMAIFEFTTFINIEADNWDEAIENFDFKLKYGNIESSDVYVAEIEEK